MSGVAVHDGRGYTAYLMPLDEAETKPDAEPQHREAIIAFDCTNGETKWRYDYKAGWIETQQAFGGRSRAPQATPAVCDGRVFVIGFTGLMHCLDEVTGEVIWRKDFPVEFEATPVQFGFAASPLPFRDRVVVLAGGASGGLVCLASDTGEVIWNVPCGEASYATPLFWKHAAGDQIVFMSRNRIVGVDAESGKPLWEFDLPSQGKTNVPTPLLINETDLLVSGQGIQGTQRMEVTQSTKGFRVVEKWRSNVEYFYCNWVRRGNLLMGSDGHLLQVIDIESGKVIGRHRGYVDANLLASNDQLLVLDGTGHLSTMVFSANELQVMERYFVFDQRCWTAPTLTGRYLICRGGNQLLCLDLEGGDPRAAVTAARIRNKTLKLDIDDGSQQPADSIQTIVAAYEAGGEKLAWKTYEKLRSGDPDAISLEQRRELAELATREGLSDFAALIRKHSEEDYPQELKEANLRPSSKTHRAANGLLYLQFIIRNTSHQTIQAFVKGPSKHPFSYGLPLRPGRARLEDWPVGTTLYRTEKGIRADVLLVVDEDFAGSTVEVPKLKPEHR